MKLYEYVNINKLGEYINDGIVTARKHPVHPLTILNYSPAAQSVKEWDSTLSRCRGLVYEDGTLDIYAIPFPKFWNYNDAGHPETLRENLPKGVPTILEKCDGSLGIGFFYRDQFIISTRGSFESDQAKWANDLVRKTLDFSEVLEGQKKLTYLLEIIWKEDRKVVDYKGTEGFFLIGVVNNADAMEIPPGLVYPYINFLYNKIIGCCLEHSYESLEELQEHDSKNAEGYVAVWYGNRTFRVKIKFDTYKRLHRMYFQTTSDVVWELVKAGQFREPNSIDVLFEGADQELKTWVMKQVTTIALDFVDLDGRAKKNFRDAIEYTNSVCDLDSSEKERRKAFSFYATQKSNPSLTFLLYDANMDKYNELLWKFVKPSKSLRFSSLEDEG